MSMMAASNLLCSHLQAQSKVANEMMDFEPILHEDAEVALGACRLSSRRCECAYTGAEMRKAPADTSDSVQKAVHAGLAIGCFVIGALGAVTTVTTTKWSVSATFKAFKRLQGHANPVSSSWQEELTTAASDRFLLSGGHADCESDVLG